MRGSTDDQVEYSPEAQRRRCAEYARSKGLDAPGFLSDQGRSRKSLDRPAMWELIALTQAGIHGVFAQHYREHNIENIQFGQLEAVRKGYWINTPPTGDDLVDRVLVANDDAHLVRRAFALLGCRTQMSGVRQGTSTRGGTCSTTGCTSGSFDWATSGSRAGTDRSSPRPSSRPSRSTPIGSK